MALSGASFDAVSAVRAAAGIAGAADNPLRQLGGSHGPAVLGVAPAARVAPPVRRRAADLRPDQRRAADLVYRSAPPGTPLASGHRTAASIGDITVTSTHSFISPWLAAAAAVDPRRLLPPAVRPPADSLAFYVVLAAVGLAEIVEWPAVLVAAAAQVIVDRRLSEIDQRRNESDR